MRSSTNNSVLNNNNNNNNCNRIYDNYNDNEELIKI
jgi:hypothetical protein